MCIKAQSNANRILQPRNQRLFLKEMSQTQKHRWTVALRLSSLMISRQQVMWGIKGVKIMIRIMVSIYWLALGYKVVSWSLHLALILVDACLDWGWRKKGPPRRWSHKEPHPLGYRGHGMQPHSASTYAGPWVHVTYAFGMLQFDSWSGSKLPFCGGPAEMFCLSR